MSFEERALKAVELRQNGYNCCQAVAAALADLTSLTEDQLMQIASGFALGIGNMEGTCGALVGAAIAAGLAAKGRGTVRMTRRISEKFRDACGSVTCKTLKGFPGGKVLCPCDQCVRNAVLAYGEVMGE